MALYVAGAAPRRTFGNGQLGQGAGCRARLVRDTAMPQSSSTKSKTIFGGLAFRMHAVPIQMRAAIQTVARMNGGRPRQQEWRLEEATTPTDWCACCLASRARSGSRRQPLSCTTERAPVSPDASLCIGGIRSGSGGLSIHTRSWADLIITTFAFRFRYTHTILDRFLRCHLHDAPAFTLRIL